jgi:hypothetical protein
MKLSFLYVKTPNFNFLDMYSRSANLKIQGKDSYNYLLSTILSILSLITILILSIYFVVTVFQRKSISVIFHLDSMDYPVVNLTGYPMTFHRYDSYGKSLKDQDKIYYVMARYLEYKVELDENNEARVINRITDIKLERCDLEKHFGKYKEYFSHSADLSLKYCLPPISQNLTIYGKFGDLLNGFSSLAINLQRCINGHDDKQDCYEGDEIP